MENETLLCKLSDYMLLLILGFENVIIWFHHCSSCYSSYRTVLFAVGWRGGGWLLCLFASGVQRNMMHCFSHVHKSKKACSPTITKVTRNTSSSLEAFAQAVYPEPMNSFICSPFPIRSPPEWGRSLGLRRCITLIDYLNNINVFIFMESIDGSLFCSRMRNMTLKKPEQYRP